MTNSKLATEEVKKYNDKPVKDKCPFCHNDLEASWNFIEIKDNTYIDYHIKCTNCTMTLTGDTMKELYAQLEGKPYY